MYWFGVKKTDPAVAMLFSRHYSARKNGKTLRDWRLHGITPPGKSITLLTPDGRALFVWVKQDKRDDGQQGVNCTVFRNEGPVLSSLLILEAEQFAWERWPGERLFTFVDGKKVRSTNPGYCFLLAGWRRCGLSAGGLVILEKYPFGQQPEEVR